MRPVPTDLLSSGAETSHVLAISVFVVLICLCILIGHLLQAFKWLNESIAAILLGFIAGAIVLIYSKGTKSHVLRFDEEIFFVYLLPPIIFNAGFQVKKKQLFHNFLTIMLFGVVGVFISFIILSAGSWWLFPKIGFERLEPRDYLVLGTIFSSTDTVCTLQVLSQDKNPLLYSLVFGEGIMNDATSVVLFNAIRKMDVSNLNGSTALHVFRDFLYLFSTSTVLGIVSGLLTAYALKTFYFGRHSTDREIALMILMAYLSYTLAELFELSGILAVFFCGIVMSHYAWYNVTQKSRTTTRHTFSTMSFIAETFIFLYVGMDALDLQKWQVTGASLKTSFGIYGVLICLLLLGRAAFVFPLSALSNYMSSNVEKSTITFHHQVIIWWAGLMRGAVSVALAFKQYTDFGVTWNPVHATIITSTVVIVLFSTMVFGLLTKPLTDALLPQSERGKNNHQNRKSFEEDQILPLLSQENPLQTKSTLALLFERPVRTIHVYWRKFDDNYMRPLFGGPSPST
ncbi:sodium/hydrogen exchanger 4-like isoform X1 [Asparagus officinalis]|uniref:sodium/hydrogen exchanger 4-like isoform X1 n=1 Tax=Asparagus officinalis TaxID=4686 RepID=UPI00098E271E|nr:sodium/hydrogen exchanger 4-like isoform X1 [Asparagus officinalis]